MNSREMNRDKRSQSPSLFGRRTSEPRVEEYPHCYSHWFSRSSRERPMTNELPGSSIRDHYNGSRLYFHKDEHFRKLSQFCENLQGESPAKKFQWENLFVNNNLANGNSKASMGLKHVNGSDGDNRGIRVSGSHLGTSSKSILGGNLRTFHMNIGATKDSNVKNNGDTSRSVGINDCNHLSSSRKYDGPLHDINEVHVRDRPIFELVENSHRGRRNETSSRGIQASHLHSSAPVAESKGISQGEFHDLLEYKRARRNHIEHFDDSNQYFSVQPCKRTDIDAGPSRPFSQHMVRIPQDDFYRDSTRTSVVMDSVVEGFQDTESHFEETTRPRDHNAFIEGSCMSTAPFAMEQYVEVLGSGTESSQDGEREAYISSEKLLLVEEDGYRTNFGKWTLEDGVNGSSVSKHKQDLGDMEDRRKLTWKAQHSTKPRVEGARSKMHDPGPGSFKKPNVFSRIQFLNHGDVKDTDFNLNCRNNWQVDEDTSFSSKRQLPWVVNHVSPRSKLKRRNLKKRLGLPLGDPNSNSLVRERERKRNKRLRKTNVDHGCLDVQTGDYLEEKVQSPTSRPPLEDPEELNQLIKSAFLKFVKVLSENPARRKKLTEPGCGIITCIVCGSKSKEFVDALSLSQHASRTLEGSRAEHLGLHKALCWLMGWSSETAPNGLWVRRILPLEEVLALKEDLIIWPPVLIIHNSSIAIDKLSDGVAISCEELEAVIRGMGCGGKIKVVRGEPGNQSIMVVTFGAMFSGLQEAERLHKSFADKSHGRDEVHKINLRHLIDSNVDLHKATGANTLESVLYGYLGLAEDLVKLDFETKKRSVVKSKKEIQAIVNASLQC
ncbi:hypothetical protein IC582_026861 [Cucumis melo]|uniref:XS domain-containing protein n=1 Tax=Cucumis melo var. makuwa TaxID=1194695 RepID=A0A5A7SQC0_CUCMM|nr:uncharacterized protein E6C27_scaffold111G00320 [Cucumis melo var. makuwa]